MIDEEQNVTGTGVEDNTDYIAAINELKANSVDRSKYDALKAENKKLLQAIVNGQGNEGQIVVEKPSIEELRSKLFKSEDSSLTNLEYIDTALKLRAALIEKGEPDPFVPTGSKYNPTQADYEKAERVATILQEMVDESEGDPHVFLNEYQRRVKK